MSSWCVCLGGCISGSAILLSSFYQGKLYMFSKLAFELFSIEISEDGDRGLMVSRVERCVTEELPKIRGTCIRRWKIAEWH